MADLNNIFQSYAEAIEKEHFVREDLSLAVKDLEKATHMATTALEKIHHSQGLQKISSICEECQKVLEQIPEFFKSLEKKLPVGEFYRYNHQFRSTTQRLVYVTTFLVYLTENRLATYSEVATRLGLTINREEGLHLDLEDYLQGSLQLGNELSRLSVNSVSAGDYARPFQISHFIRELHSSYSLLNPKGELRKRFDELKYSLKKSEEVVYNLTLRGLKPQESEGTSG